MRRTKRFCSDRLQNSRKFCGNPAGPFRLSQEVSGSLQGSRTRRALQTFFERACFRMYRAVSRKTPCLFRHHVQGNADDLPWGEGFSPERQCSPVPQCRPFRHAATFNSCRIMRAAERFPPHHAPAGARSLPERLPLQEDPRQTRDPEFPFRDAGRSGCQTVRQAPWC